MKIISPLPHKRGRIEIIPLIDIMFFLLAAFMVVSIDKIKVKSLKVALPTDVPVSQLEPKEDFVSVSLDSEGHVQIDKEVVSGPNALLPKLQEIYVRNKDQKILISADKEARSGDLIALLGKVRTAGFQKVGFNLKGGTNSVPGLGSSLSAPTPPSAPTDSSIPAPATPPAAPSAPPAPPAAPPAPPAPPASQ